MRDPVVDALCEIPPFLKRKAPTKKQLEKPLTLGERKVWAMPTYRPDPRRAAAAKSQRQIPSKDRSKNRQEKAEKVTHPTTEALKSATGDVKGEAKRQRLYEIAVENDLVPSKWDHLNVGQVAMNLSNVLRGRYYKMQQVVIDGKTID